MLKKNIVASFLFCISLFLLSSQAKADGIHYSLISYAGLSGKTIDRSTANLAYAINITNNSSTSYTNASLVPTQLCLSSVAGPSSTLNGKIALDCMQAPAGTVTFDLPAYSSKVIPIAGIYKIHTASAPNTAVSISSTGAEASLIGEVDFKVYTGPSDTTGMAGSTQVIFKAFVRESDGSTDFNPLDPLSIL